MRTLNPLTATTQTKPKKVMCPYAKHLNIGLGVVAKEKILLVFYAKLSPHEK